MHVLPCACHVCFTKLVVQCIDRSVSRWIQYFVGFLSQSITCVGILIPEAGYWHEIQFNFKSYITLFSITSFLLSLRFIILLLQPQQQIVYLTVCEALKKMRSLRFSLKSCIVANFKSLTDVCLIMLLARCSMCWDLAVET